MCCCTTIFTTQPFLCKEQSPGFPPQTLPRQMWAPFLHPEPEGCFSGPHIISLSTAMRKMAILAVAPSSPLSFLEPSSLVGCGHGRLLPLVLHHLAENLVATRTNGQKTSVFSQTPRPVFGDLCVFFNYSAWLPP